VQDPGAQPPTTPSRGRLRRILLLVLLVGTVSLVGVLGYGFLLYDQATKPDRSTPDVAANNYLLALLVERDDVRANLFACRNKEGLADIRAFRDEIVAREKQLGVSMIVNVALGRVEPLSGDRATVTATVARSAVIDGVSQSVTDQWQLNAVQQDGWRVCEAQRVPA
jgi:hypothetical protein